MHHLSDNYLKTLCKSIKNSYLCALQQRTMRLFFKRLTDASHNALLSKQAKHGVEKLVFIAAIAGFFIHLVLIFLAQWGFVQADGIVGLSSPIEALYTPFSIILFYEVYCLIYFLPRSITHYIGIQFEIMALILIRAAFDEMTKLTAVSTVGEMFTEQNFLYLLVTIFVLFALIYVFYKLNQDRVRWENGRPAPDDPPVAEPPAWYFASKRRLALFMGILFVILSVVAIVQMVIESASILEFVDQSKIYTRELFINIFIILIICDVIILLLSFAITHEFPIVIRNSGYVISTILLKLSFSIPGVVGYLLVLMAALFTIGILLVFKRFQKIELPEE